MNASKIVDMIDAGEAPELPANPNAFKARVNLENVQQTVTEAVVVQQAVQVTTSIAKMNGGHCTNADLLAAESLIRSRTQKARVDLVMERTQQEITAGTITNLATLKTRMAAIVSELT